MVAVGKVVRPHGLRGEVIVESWSDIADRFETGAVLTLDPSTLAATRRLEIAAARHHQGRLLVQFLGIEDREAAENLRGAVLTVAREQVPPAPEGSYYHFELVGCRVLDDPEGDLGEVVAVLDDGGGTLLEVAEGSRRLLVPFVSAYLLGVDLADRRIDTKLPPGLVEECASTS